MSKRNNNISCISRRNAVCCQEDEHERQVIQKVRVEVGRYSVEVESGGETRFTY